MVNIQAVNYVDCWNNCRMGTLMILILNNTDLVWLDTVECFCDCLYVIL